MDFLLFLATFVLFFVLTPGVILSLPPKGSKLVTALVHALLFAILLTLFMECFKTDDKEGFLTGTNMTEAYGEVDRIREEGKEMKSQYKRIVADKRQRPLVGGEIPGGDGMGSSDYQAM